MENGFQLAQVTKKNGQPVKHYVVLDHAKLEAIKTGFKARYGVIVETPTQLADVLVRIANGNLGIDTKTYATTK